jgi:hypothetical protein
LTGGENPKFFIAELWEYQNKVHVTGTAFVPDSSNLPTALISSREERRAMHVCPHCGGNDQVFVTPFRWSRERQLHWGCRSCSHVWIMPERRSQERA